MPPRPQPDVATAAAAGDQRGDLLAGALAIAARIFDASHPVALERRDLRALVLVPSRWCALRERRRWTRRLAAVAAVFVVAALPARATAAVEERCAGPGVRADRISIQLFDFIVYVMGDFAQPNPPAVQRARTAEVLRRAG